MTKVFNEKATAEQVLSGLNLNGKRILVTGVSSGIGLETARSLIAQGADVVGTVRDTTKADELTKSITKLQGGGKLELIKLDLASIRSVHSSAEKLLRTGQKFDVIIANAGVMATPFSRTVDGFEFQLATNYLGHFVLINKIAPLIEDKGRVVILSSQAHRVADVNLDDLNFASREYDPFISYGQSKTAGALFAVEFDKRHRNRGIRAVSVMPGNSATNLPRHFSNEGLQALLNNVVKARAEAGLAPDELKDVTQAAATSVWAAIVADKDEIGGRYLEHCSIAQIDDTPNPFADGVKSYALDANHAQKLWEKTELLLSNHV